MLGVPQVSRKYGLDAITLDGDKARDEGQFRDGRLIGLNKGNLQDTFILSWKTHLKSSHDEIGKGLARHKTKSQK